MYLVYHKESLFAICYLCFLYEILTENIPPIALERIIMSSFNKNIREILNEGIMIALMQIQRHMQSPQISPLIRPPEFFLNAERKPPTKEEK